MFVDDCPNKEALGWRGRPCTQSQNKKRRKREVAYLHLEVYSSWETLNKGISVWSPSNLRISRVTDLSLQ